MKLNKVLCVCGSGLGSSFLMEMNVKKVLENNGIKDATVEHSTISDAFPGCADLIICGNDLYDAVAHCGDVIKLSNIISIQELDEKIKEYLSSKGIN